MINEALRGGYSVLIAFLLLFGVLSAESMSIDHIESDRIDYRGSEIVLTGNVRVGYNKGIITCDKATLEISKRSGPKKVNKEASSKVDSSGALGAENIFLEGHVDIYFPDGDRLTADKADINCKLMEGIFYSIEPNKVVFYTTLGDGDEKVPVKASSKKLKTRLSKQGEGTGYSLSNLEGEGAVIIEYIKPKQDLKQDPKQAPRSKEIESITSPKNLTEVSESEPISPPVSVSGPEPESEPESEPAKL